MKKMFALLSAVVMALSVTACKRSMNDIINNEPSVTGIVEEVSEHSILIYCEQMQGYPTPVKCSVSLDVEYSDSMTSFDVGDRVVVYYNGEVAESYPLQINTVYAITLHTPADRETE